MFKIKNQRTGKITKDAITGKAFTFPTQDAAQKMADSLRRSSVLNATAWNSTRPSFYQIIPA